MKISKLESLRGTILDDYQTRFVGPSPNSPHGYKTDWELLESLTFRDKEGNRRTIRVFCTIYEDVGFEEADQEEIDRMAYYDHPD